MPKTYGKVTAAKDLSILLKDIEPIIKDPEKLLKGRKITNFNLRPREAVGLFLIGAVFNKLSEEPYYVTTDPQTYDGTLSRKGSGYYYGDFLTEQTMVTEYQGGDINDCIIDAVRKKEKHGENYGRDRNLVVFLLNKVGEIDHRKVQMYMKSARNFKSYWLIGFTEPDDGEYNCFVAVLKSSEDAQYAYKVHINPDFRTWTVELLRGMGV